MKRLRRKYRFSDVDMLMASTAIVHHLSDNLRELSTVRPNWNEELVDTLKKRIDTGFDKYLGQDPAKELREATTALLSLIKPVLRDIQLLKIQVRVDFGEEADGILKNLGYMDPSWFDKKYRNQEALIGFLKSFEKGMDPELKKKITSRGIAPDLIRRLLDYANRIIEAEVLQENLKINSKKHTRESKKYFNELYLDIIGICKIASSYYKNDLLKKEKFTFSKIIRNLGNTLDNKSGASKIDDGFASAKSDNYRSVTAEDIETENPEQ